MRVAAQFTPYSWTDFDWRPTSSLKRWLAMLGVISIVSSDVKFNVQNFIIQGQKVKLTLCDSLSIQGQNFYSCLYI